MGTADDAASEQPRVANKTGRAFNGTQYQSLMDSVVQASSKETFADRHASDPYFLEAFRFVRTAETPGVISLDMLRKENTWEGLKQYATVVGRQTVAGHSCVVVELVIPNLNSRGRIITRRVYFGEDVGFFPVRCESMLGEDRVRVLEFEAENIREFKGPGGETFHLFGKGNFEAWHSTGRLFRIRKIDIDLDAVAYNTDIPDSRFSLLSAGIVEYWDYDNPANNFNVNEDPSHDDGQEKGAIPG